MIRWRRHRSGGDPESGDAVLLCQGCHRRPAGDVVVIELTAAGERMTFCSRECAARRLIAPTSPTNPAPDPSDVGVI